MNTGCRECDLIQQQMHDTTALCRRHKIRQLHYDMESAKRRFRETLARQRVEQEQDYDFDSETTES